MAIPIKSLLLGGVGGIAGLLVLSMAVQGVMSQKRPDTLGLVDGRLRPCPPGSRNCVCSEAGSPGSIEPFALAVDAHTALERIAVEIRSTPRTRVITEEQDYLHAEYTSLIFRFVDDVEFRVDPRARLMHVRSASRVGKGDLGVNRKRIEALRARLQSAGTIR